MRHESFSMGKELCLLPSLSGEDGSGRADALLLSVGETMLGEAKLE